MIKNETDVKWPQGYKQSRELYVYCIYTTVNQSTRENVSNNILFCKCHICTIDCVQLQVHENTANIYREKRGTHVLRSHTA